ncbi:MAG: LysR family transcriptional regulator [Hyphomicrobiales bacterium]
MNWTDVPSLNALKAFSVLAKTGNYSRAGTQLNVTHAAILQQVKALEEWFDAQLVTRSGRGVVLTREGETLARELEAGFARIHEGVQMLAGVDSSLPVQVTMSPAFAVKWLMPRIVDFQSRFPDITLLLNPTGRMISLGPDGPDLAIRYGRHDWNIAEPDILIDLDLVVVGTPDLIGRHKIASPHDLIHVPWLQEFGTSEATDWFARHNITLEHPLTITHMPGNLIVDEIKRGNAVTYTTRQWFEQEISSGELVELFPEEDAGFFYIHTRPGKKRKAVRVFTDWLKQQSRGVF